MKFVTRHGQVIDIDPLNQASISRAKALAPGEGVSLAVTSALIAEIVDGNVITPNQLPAEYHRLGKLLFSKPRVE